LTVLNMQITGNPITKLRPRFTRQGRTYDSQKLEKEAARCIIMQQMSKNRQIRRIKGAIMVNLTFHTPIPKSWSQKRRKAVLGRPDTRKPDIDNLAKFILDVMNKLVYEDDNQITTLHCEMIFSENPRTEIQVKEIEDED